MKLYSVIDLRSTNSYVAIIDEKFFTSYGYSLFTTG